MNTISEKFLSEHGMHPAAVDPLDMSDKFEKCIREGLESVSCLPMIPTYLKNDGAVPMGTPAVIIDAGGTNFRAALVTFNENGFTTENMTKKSMPGIGSPCSWEEFISFVADNIEPFMPFTDKIGFCFSYSADITEDIDGRVIRIDKEVVVSGSEGKLVGRSLSDELAKRGYPGKKVIILNDTAAVLIGGSSILDKSQYDDFIGQVSGTGTNTCCIFPTNAITKLGKSSDTPILVNLESGLFDQLQPGSFDLMLDKASNNPGSKFFEKMTAGVYLGELVRLMLEEAGKTGILSAACYEKIAALGKFNSAVIDSWSCGEGFDGLCADDNDKAFITNISKAMFERSARLMSSNIIGIARATGKGTGAKPVCVCAEGSLVQKSRFYLPALNECLRVYGKELLGINIVMKVGDGSTVPGTAAAALLN